MVVTRRFHAVLPCSVQQVWLPEINAANEARAALRRFICPDQTEVAGNHDAPFVWLWTVPAQAEFDLRLGIAPPAMFSYTARSKHLRD